MPIKKRILYVLLLLTFSGGFIAYTYLYKPHRTIEKETAKFELKAKKIIRSFLDDQELANDTYLNQTLIITGNITEIDQNTIIVDDQLYARFGEPLTAKEGHTVRFKGRCIGYDDLLEELRFDQCHLLEHH